MSPRDYLTLLRESWLIVVGGMVLGIVIGTVLTFVVPPSYESTAVFYVSTPNSSGNASDNYNGAQLSAERVASYSELLTGLRVASDASAELGGNPDPDTVQDRISTETTDQTVVLTMTVSGRSPEDANRVAKAVSDVFLRLVGGLETPRAAPGTAAAAPTVLTQVVLPPTFTPDPVSPKLALDVPIGAVVGIVLALGVAIVRRTLDVTISSPEQLEEVVDAAVLGAVPTDPAATENPVALLDTGDATDERHWLRAEAYRRIRTNFEFADVDVGHRVVVVSSTDAGEGKTSLSLNLATALAAVGSRVVVVDADLRRPQALKVLGLDGTVGLTTVITGAVDLATAVQHWAPGGIDLLGAGVLPPRPNELLASKAAAGVLAALRERYDVVVVDSPPLGPVTDAANLARHADGVLLVCRASSTSRHDLARVVSTLRLGGIAILGAVLSGVRLSASSKRSYYGRDDAGTSSPRTATPAMPATPGVPAPPPPPAARTSPSPPSPAPAGPPPSLPVPRPAPVAAGRATDLGEDARTSRIPLPVAARYRVAPPAPGPSPAQTVAVAVIAPPTDGAPADPSSGDGEVGQDDELAHDEADGGPDGAAERGEEEGRGEAHGDADPDRERDGVLVAPVLQQDGEGLVEGGDDRPERQNGHGGA